jgi:hypothetical protein
MVVRHLISRSVLLLTPLAFLLLGGFDSLRASPRWWKGNLHTHSLWSDGDDYPEMITAWYRTNDYHFLGISDHNTLQNSKDRWISPIAGINNDVFRKYLEHFGSTWIEQRMVNGTNFQVRLKSFNEYRGLFEATNEFLLLQNEEITGGYYSWPVHLVASNVRELIFTPGGRSVLEVLQNSINLVNAQREATGQPMIVHVAHPNYGWGITAEDLAQLRGEKFFEVYSGHPVVNSLGDAQHPSTERMWDILLTQRLSQLNLEPLFGLAVDDAHQYQLQSPGAANAGRGWVMVRAETLSPKSLIVALEAGDFYSSSGVTLNDVRRDTNRLYIDIRAETNVTYVTQFIGTRINYDPASEPIRDGAGAVLPITRVYSKSVGQTLAEMAGPNPTYTFQGNEYYVRAKIISSKPKMNPALTLPNEVECAWTQPMVVRLPKLSIGRAAPGSLRLSSPDSSFNFQIQKSFDLIHWSPANPIDLPPNSLSTTGQVFFRAVVPVN